MNPTNLKQLLSGHAPERTAIITPNSLLRYGNLRLNCYKGAVGASIVIFSSDILFFANAFAALDGFVSAVCPVSTGMKSEDIIAIREQWDFDFVVTDAEADCTVFREGGLECFPLDALIDRSDCAASQAVETKWLVPTSGTTSTPKLVCHTFETLAHSAIAARQIGEPPQIWALLYDVTRFAGYQVFFHALLSGHTLVRAGEGASVDEQVATFAANGVTHMSATPTMWRKVLMLPAHRRMPLQQITLGGEPADQPTLTALRKAYPKARITHMFASTETGVGMAASDGLAGYPLSYLDESFGGVEVRIKDGRLNVRRAGGYSTRYTDNRVLVDGDGWFDTGDLVQVDGNRFFIIGRKSGIINVGGDKVVPEQVRDVLLACDLVQDAFVYGKKNPFTGALVAADIVLIDTANERVASDIIKRHMEAVLSGPQRPRIFRFVSKIKVNATGKAVVE